MNGEATYCSKRHKVTKQIGSSCLKSYEIKFLLYFIERKKTDYDLFKLHVKVLLMEMSSNFCTHMRVFLKLYFSASLIVIEEMYLLHFQNLMKEKFKLKQCLFCCYGYHNNVTNKRISGPQSDMYLPELLLQSTLVFIFTDMCDKLAVKQFGSLDVCSKTCNNI